MHFFMSEMLTEAQRKGYAVGYFESWNLVSVWADVKAAEEVRSPLIVGFNGIILEQHNYELEYYASIGRTTLDLATVPTALLLNEVSSFQQIIRAIRLGFSAVMIDVSPLPFEKAIELTKKVVETAHLVNVNVEAQFDTLPKAKNGVLGGIKNINLTDPKKAAKFVEKTNIDALSISIGNVHGLYKGKAYLNLQRLQEIRELIETPLVLHGATGIPDEDVKKAVRLGICKIIIGHVLRLAFMNVLKRNLEKGTPLGLEKISDSAKEEIKELIKNKMRIYGCAGRV